MKSKLKIPQQSKDIWDLKKGALGEPKVFKTQNLWWRNSVSHSVVSHSATPGTVARQAPLPVGFSMQEYWSRLPFPSPGDLPHPETEPRFPALQADSLPSEPPGNPRWIESSVFTEGRGGFCEMLPRSPFRNERCIISTAEVLFKEPLQLALAGSASAEGDYLIQDHAPFPGHPVPSY